MSLEIEVLEYLSKKRPTLRYKGLRVGLLGLPDFNHYKYQTLANRFSILSKKEFIRKSDKGEYFITARGREFLEKQKNILKKFKGEENESSPKDLLIVYDIPENKKKEREWFRFHLKKFNFFMIQKSVWVGPSPLPKDFLEYLDEIKLGDNFKKFKLSKGYGKK